MRSIAILLLGLLASSAAAAQNVTPPDANPTLQVDSATGQHLRIFVATYGPGDAVWEKFGHNAIWVQDARTGQTLSYNWGSFDFAQPGFVPRLVQGGMLYWLDVRDAQREADAYVYFNRSITLQELDLTAAQKAELNAFVQWNAREENKYYNYHYYRDNCSTRVRDVIDRVTGGALRNQLVSVATDETFRSHSLRLVAGSPLTYTGIELGLADSVDHPLNAWEEAFIPMELSGRLRDVRIDGRPLVLSETQPFQSSRAASESRPNRVLIYLLLGILIGGAFALAGRFASQSRATRWAFALAGTLWAAVVGFFGVLVLLLWTSTGHTFTYGNENLFLVNPLPLLLVVLLPLALLRRRAAARPAFIVAAFTAAGAILGLLLKILPGFDQMNHDILALMLPAHLGLAAGLYVAGRKLSS